VGHTSLITSLSVPSVNPAVGLFVILVLKVLDILHPVTVAIALFEYLLKWPADRVN
jgi:hypothetical protein